MTGGHTEQALRASARPLVWRMAWLGGVAALAGLMLVLALAAWSARAGLLRTPIWVPAAWVAALLAGAVCLALVFRAARGLGSHRLAARLEEHTEWRRGALRGLLEPPSEGTSDGLRAAADQATALDVAARAPAALGRERSRIGRLLAAAAVGVVGCGLLLGAAGIRRRCSGGRGWRWK